MGIRIEVSKVTLSQLRLSRASYVDLRIGVKEDAAFKGGLNLFGRRDMGQGSIPQVWFGWAASIMAGRLCKP